MLNPEFRSKLVANALPRKHFTKEQIEVMNQVDLVNFMLWYDETQIIRNGSNYRLANNHSVVLHENYAKDFAKSNSYAKGEKNPCRPIDFCLQYLGLSVYQAMYVLSEFVNRPDPAAPPVKTSISYRELERRLEDGRYIKANGNRNIYAYLAGTRKIERDVILEMHRENLLYAEPLTKGYNLLFAFRESPDSDIEGFERCGILSNRENRYKGSIVATPYAAFSCFVEQANTYDASIVFAFESAIDVLSFLSLVRLEKITLPKNRNVWVLSMRGLNYKTTEKFFAEQIGFSGCDLGLCVDSDKAGQAFCQNAKKQWEHGNIFDFTDILSAQGVKDWNELLIKGMPETVDLESHFVSVSGDIDDMDMDFEGDDELPF